MFRQSIQDFKLFEKNSVGENLDQLSETSPLWHSYCIFHALRPFSVGKLDMLSHLTKDKPTDKNSRPIHFD
jgi:hypothetical protein